MTTLANLLAQKQELIARLQHEDIGPEERDEIERLLEKIETALDFWCAHQSFQAVSLNRPIP
jgi:hypothetical protein